MKIVIAQMSHETNTFSPVVTNLARFSRGDDSFPPVGDDAKRIFRGTASCLGGFLRIAESTGAEVELTIAASAPPSGPVEDEAYETIVKQIIAAAATQPDAIMLDLHGAMVTRAFEDGEGELLRRIRTVAPKIPIAVALDMHANIFPAIVEHADVVVGYHTYPHIDMEETAVGAGQILLMQVGNQVQPLMAWGNVPMLPHVMRQGTDDLPNQALQRRAKEMEKTRGVLAVSLFTGFPHADVTEAGLSVVVVSDNDLPLAEKLRDELLDLAWQERAKFVYQVEPLADSMTRAKTLAGSDGPVLLLDHYDNTASGGTMDTTEVLAEILANGLEDVAVFGIYDPDIVQDLIAVGVGNEATVALGGKLPMPALQVQSKPLVLTGRVKLISEGRFPATVQMSRGLTLDMGKTVLFSVGSVDIAVISKHTEPFDPGCFRSLGIETTQRRFLMLKSRVHYRVGFGKLVKHVVECAGVGVCTSDYSTLSFEKVRRPIYPLEDIPDRTVDRASSGF